MPGFKPPPGGSQGESGSSKTLWLIGAGAVLGVLGIRACTSDPGVTVRRAVYASQQECAADWGSQPGDCENLPPDASSSSSHGGGGFYRGWYGPYYSANGTVYHADGTTTQRTPTGATGMPRPLTSYGDDGRTVTNGWVADAPAHAQSVEEATLRRSALGGGRPLGLSMRTAAITHGASSRGGFISGLFHSGGG
ncbi:MAG: hypothetical protein FWC58_00620 [Desulfobulbus sp.]|nr:hypothetical protein [Desulfobulbus sp.]